MLERKAIQLRGNPKGPDQPVQVAEECDDNSITSAAINFKV